MSNEIDSENEKSTALTGHLVTPEEEKELAEKYAKMSKDMAEQDERNAKTEVMAIRIGYDGSLDIEVLMEAARYARRKTAEWCLRQGQIFLLIKEKCEHGEFQSRIEEIGFSVRLAQQFMKAALVMSNTKLTSLLGSIDSQSKLLEIVTLDNDSLEEISDGGSVGGITKDSLKKMSMSELRKVCHDYRERLEAKDKLIQQKNATIDRITEDNAKMENKLMLQTPQEQMLAQRDRFQRHAMTIKAHIMTDFRRELKELYEQDGDHRDFAAACFIEIFKELSILRDEYNLERVIREDGMPEWLTPEGLAEIEAMGGEG